MTPALRIDHEQLEAYCRRWQIIELALFGSVLRDDFRPDSDVDVLVTFGPDARWTLFDLLHAEEELSALVGRPVDLVERKAVEGSENYIRRRHILDSAQSIYVAA